MHRDVQNATGLDISAGANATGNEVVTLTFADANTGAGTGITTGTTPGAGDTITVGEQTYQFVDDAANVSAGQRRP